MSDQSKKRYFVAEGILNAELNEFLKRELAAEGYGGVELKSTPNKKAIIISATKPENVLGEKGKRVEELTSVIKKRWGLEESNVELYVDQIDQRGLSAVAQAESLKFKLLGGIAVRKACYGVIRYVMDAGAKGVEVIVSGKLRAQRAKAMKFRDGYLLRTGHPVEEYVDVAVRHVKLRQGVLGIKVKIMLPQGDGKKNSKLPTKPLPDHIKIGGVKER